MRQPRLDSLTGLRFFAALAVVAYHASGHLTPGPWLADAVRTAASAGFAGVSFFYILSGFVLAWSHSEGVGAGTFYRRRFARIAPLYWLSVVLFTAYSAYASGAVGETVRNAVPSVFAVQAWVPDSAVYFGGNRPGWSISVEAFFYLLFPLVIVIARSSAARRWLWGAAIVLALAIPLALHPTSESQEVAYWAVYVFPVQRLAEFLIGVLVAKAVQSGWKSPLSLGAAVALTLAAYVVAVLVPLWASISIVTLAPFALLLSSAAAADLAGAPSIFRRRGLVRLGEWSFALYLIHVLALQLQSAVLDRLGAVSSTVEFAFLGATILAAIAASGLLYTYFERPLERRLRGSRPRPEMQAAAGS
ncbi:acyltransferase family protein [Nocardioides bruguierae]|uniref:Acyltransferase n=1 Tax=Nocardioides bruguierae TaxID=2945102 RepID=A0A9X2IGY4_9ACTN|nr:acyltransferase [Nocardioides bruguierae]MCM0622837.1 acyltransferase [Nocardioides bruguierae]